MAVAIADRWFERRRIDDDITLIWEPHVDPLIRCNIWHVRGRDRDLMVDTGLGIASLRAAARDLLAKPVIALATHTHYDHSGSMNEFAERVVHRAEAATLAEPPPWAALRAADMPATIRRMLTDAGYPLGEALVTAYPHPGFDPGAFRTPPAAPTRLVDEGDIIDLGNRAFEVLHLPGHSPGSIGLFEAESGVLFSGDAIYDGPLLDELPGSDIAAYVATMRRLKALSVSVVHGGHDPSFGRARLLAIADAYLARRAA